MGRKTRHRGQAAGQWPDLRDGALLVLLTLAAYALVVEAGFIWDDDAYITNNLTLRSPEGLWRIWTEIGAVPQYYPLVHSMFWIEYHLWSLSPVGYHLVNVALHAASAVLLWRVLWQLRVPGAWLAAAVFAVHPVCVESVAWVTEGKNVLSLALALAAILCYFRFAPPADRATADEAAGAWRWYAAALALFAAALLSKTVVATLPAVLVVIYWWKGALARRTILPLLPLFALAIGLGLLTVWMEEHRVGARGELWSFSPVERLLIAGRALWFYAARLVWPYPLVFFYPRWTIDAGQAWQYVFPAAAWAVIIGLWMARTRIGRGPLAAVLIFAGVMAPAIGFFNVYPFRYSFVADHFQYHAAPALIALAAAGAATLAARLKPSGQSMARLAAGAVLVVLLVLTLAQTRIYANLETLYRHTLAHNPKAWIAYTNLAHHLAGQGRVDDGLALLRQAEALEPGESTVYGNLGVYLFQKGKRDGFRPGQLDEVIAYYRRALELDAANTVARINLAHALIAANDRDAAMAELRSALTFQPPAGLAAQVRINLGRLHAEQKDLPAAIREFQEALRLAPENFEALSMLGTTYGMAGEIDLAIKYLNAALRERPGHPQTQANLRQALQAKWSAGGK